MEDQQSLINDLTESLTDRLTRPYFSCKIVDLHFVLLSGPPQKEITRRPVPQYLRHEEITMTLEADGETIMVFANGHLMIEHHTGTQSIWHP